MAEDSHSVVRGYPSLGVGDYTFAHDFRHYCFTDSGNGDGKHLVGVYCGVCGTKRELMYLADWRGLELIYVYEACGEDSEGE